MKNIIIIAIVVAAIYFISQNYKNIIQTVDNSLKNEKTVSKVVNTRDANHQLEEDITNNPENY
ncbi:hypothetical protein IJI31_07640 [bacterium]|nr:hypothetical protein [bacterium]